MVFKTEFEIVAAARIGNVIGRGIRVLEHALVADEKGQRTHGGVARQEKIHGRKSTEGRGRIRPRNKAKRRIIRLAHVSSRIVPSGTALRVAILQVVPVVTEARVVYPI